MIISHIVGKNQNQLHQSSNFIIQSKVHFPRSHISNFVKASQGVQAPPNLELVPMSFKLKQVDISTYLGSKGFAPGARLVWVFFCVEDEKHALYDCDLSSRERSKLISNLNNIPFTYQDSTENVHSHEFHLNFSNLEDYLPYILSPNVLINGDLNGDWIESLHKPSALNIDPQSPSHSCFQKRRSYAITNICTFVLKCFDDRRKLIETTRRSTSETRTRNTIIVNIRSTQPGQA